MWKALASDLNVFVNTVAGDTSEALTRMDDNFPDNLSPASEERLRRIESHETFDLPLISEDDDEEYKKDVKQFLATFSLESKTDEITALLLENPDTLKLAFEALVPTKVSYEDFWQRYFYRCDEERIKAEIEQEEEEEKAAHVDAFSSIAAVGTLLGGAVKAVSKSIIEDDKTGSPMKPFQMTQNQASKAGIFGTDVFGTSGRPPFVLNTAAGEEEDEEELGWDDEEEEGNGRERRNEDDDGQQQIEFKDAVTEKLQEQLKLALAERDLLHQTVAMQQKEIASLQTHGAENAVIEELKTLLFEKESEIAALRASALDHAYAGPGNDSLQATDIAKIQDLEQRLQELTKKVDEGKNALESAIKEKEALKAQLSTLRSATNVAKEEIANLKNENNSLRAKLGESETHLSTLEEDHHQSEASADLGEASVDSPDTGSTTVKVEAPTTGKPAGEEDGGWDDDW